MRVNKQKLLELYRITRGRRAILDREMARAQAERQRVEKELNPTYEQEMDLDRAYGRMDRINAIRMMGLPPDKRSAQGPNVPPFVKKTGIVSDDALKASMTRSKWLEGK